MKRKIALALTMAMLGTCLAGCGQADTDTNASTEAKDTTEECLRLHKHRNIWHQSSEREGRWKSVTFCRLWLTADTTANI